jgi:hypothetical protein
MADFSRFQAPAWDRFFDFICEGDEELSDDQVRDELRHRGIDVTRALSKVQQAVCAARARKELEAAKRSRPAILERLKRIRKRLPDVGGTLDDVKRALASELQGRPQLQGTFFRKLEAAASEDDLRSLLEDSQLLDLLGKEDPDDGTQGE